MSVLNYTHMGETPLLADDLALVDLFRTKSEWIWTKELTTPPASRANEQRAFRKTFTNTRAANAQPVNATIIIAVDNYYALYVNGALLHAADPKNNFANALIYKIPVYHDKLVFAVRAINSDDGGGPENPAGVKAAIGIASEGNPSTLYYSGKDQTFLGETLFGEGWEKPDYDDRSWAPAIVQNGPRFRSTWVSPNVPTTANHATIDPSAFSQSDAGTRGYVPLQTGQVIGIAVGTFAVGALLAAVVTYLVARHRFLNRPVRPVAPQREIQPVTLPSNQYSIITPFTGATQSQVTMAHSHT